MQLLTPLESDLLRSCSNATVKQQVVVQLTPGQGSVLSISGFHLGNGTTFNMTLHGNGDTEVRMSNTNIYCWNRVLTVCGENGLPDGRLGQVIVTDYYFSDPSQQSDITTLEGNSYSINGILFKCNKLGECLSTFTSYHTCLVVMLLKFVPIF